MSLKQDDFLELPVLPAKQQAFVDWIATGLTPTAAARKSGYSHAPQRGGELLINPAIRLHIEYHQAQHAKEMGMTRERIQEGLLEAIDVARELGDAGSMIRGWAEVARVTGLNAPAKQEVDITVNAQGEMTKAKLRALPTTQLLELVGQEPAIEDVEFEEIFDQDLR